MNISFLLAFTLYSTVAPEPQWRIGQHDPIICFVWCYEDEQNPVNIELARATFHDNGWTFHEWVGSATVIPGQWQREAFGELHDVWFTQAGVHWGVRSPGAVNVVFKAGVLASWLHARGDIADATRLTPRIELGSGVAERLEFTLGLGYDGLSAHIGWRF